VLIGWLKDAEEPFRTAVENGNVRKSVRRRNGKGVFLLSWNHF
jgi:hypothetical protein